MIFEAGQRTPLVELTPTSCLIRGECYPENISEWSEPVLKTLEDCLGNDESEFKVDIELYYFNSSSAKFLFDFFEFLGRVQKMEKRLPSTGGIALKTTPCRKLARTLRKMYLPVLTIWCW